jgi:hypothetical protein
VLIELDSHGIEAGFVATETGAADGAIHTIDSSAGAHFSGRAEAERS